MVTFAALLWDLLVTQVRLFRLCGLFEKVSKK